MNASVKSTNQSLAYRRKAAHFARLAEAERDEIKMVTLANHALSWIQMAENEEFLADAPGDNRQFREASHLQGGALDLHRRRLKQDQWNEQLQCPQCRNAGAASLSQLHDAEMPTVERVPDGFKSVQTEYGPRFYCAACDLPVMP